jgi:hypothetical protein
MPDTADASKIYRETSDAARPVFTQMPLSITWSPTDHIAWVSDGSAKPPVLSRMWRRMETGEEDWRPLETILVRPSIEAPEPRI